MKLLSVDELLQAMESKNAYPFNSEQRLAITHANGPLWIIAGPGTGKTEVLVMRTLKLLCCDGMNPRAVIVTTFTEKAALNLENRIASGMLYLADYFAATRPEIARIDYCQLRIGTLHSLCNDVMQECRYQPFQNIKLMDAVEQAMLIEQTVTKYMKGANTDFQGIKGFFFPENQAKSSSKWVLTKKLSPLMDRIIEDDVDITMMKRANLHWRELADFFEFYEQELRARHLCDFPHLEKYFLDFLQTPQGAEFLAGTAQMGEAPVPVQAVLVDEYQDTNPIQERIYFKLASKPPHNLCVVGDDDQALYRFRGGTVDGMIHFGTRCKQCYGMAPVSIGLSVNYRSNAKIVDWCNTYIQSFPQMRKSGARVAGKAPLQSVPGNPGLETSVGCLFQSKKDDLAAQFAIMLEELLAHHIIEDYSQCVLILPSVKNSARNARPFLEALAARNIPVYNPRAKAFLDHDEVRELMGAFVSMIDPEISAVAPHIVSLAECWRDAYRLRSSGFPELERYVEKSRRNIQNNVDPQKVIVEYTAGILYRILSFEPFVTYQTDPERDMRLSKLTRIFESFLSLNERSLKVDKNAPSTVNRWWLNSFYMSLCGYLAEYGMDDDEDEDVICPKGFFPLMTIHQSKGLEFDFVFAGNLGNKVKPDTSHFLEKEYSQFRKNPPAIPFTQDELAWQDDIRKHFVTYSRAKHALVLLMHGQPNKTGSASFGSLGGGWFKNNYRPV